MHESSTFERLRSALADGSATAGVIGLGYVGLPLAVSAARAGYRTVGFDIDTTKPERLNAGASYIDAVTDDELGDVVTAQRFTATSDFDRLAECDVIVICVPTPLTRHREPDLSYIEETARQTAARLRPGQLVVLESTTYPGTTREVLTPILESSGLQAGADFFVGFSPEREDPGNARFRTVTIPKVVAGDGPQASELVASFYGKVVETVVPVSTPDVAEAVKITENVFRAVNIALVNELKLIYGAMGIDVWEVIEAAKTKPFGYMPFYPGPGLGGHCIPIDPFYLTWKAREFDLGARFIELAGEINTAMPNHVVEVLDRALDQRFQKALSASKVLVIGLAYKPDVADVRESPSFKLMELLEARGAEVSFHDPHVPEVPPTREHAEYNGRRSAELTPETLAAVDAVLISTDHAAVDYALVSAHAKLVVDSRNAMARRGLFRANVVKA
ncbi:nucleotide sugar dehydrogenase [Phenylobacterium sp.]|jgi:UDP-N-acetyl-D-glucosamine dehydrogenase|uniref:nucleotide sugar dehydrogenase n=1 Tax=Phenylobacterium sp. TaxID=1871053 RepID=UPI002F94C96D